MVFPLYDDNTDRRSTPVVTWVLIGINVFVFVVLQGLGENTAFTYSFALVPEEIVTGRDIVVDDRGRTHPLTGEVYHAPPLRSTPGSVYLTLLTSMFLHGSLMHLLGNMLFLWIFGDNVEDDLGRARYLLFYLLTGAVASAAHIGATYALGSDPRIPCLGASGAISGVLGGYIVLHPHRKVVVLLIRILTAVPAWVAIGMWFLFQLISSLGALGEGTQSGGVAYGAHIGGFLAGMALIKPFAALARTPTRRWAAPPPTGRGPSDVRRRRR